MTAPAALVDRIARVQSDIQRLAERAGRDPNSVTLVGVSKTVGWPEILSSYELGIRHFGENRVQDTKARIPTDRPPELTLHLIGQLQTNKVGQALEMFDVVESVDRPSLIAELEKQAARRDRVVPVLLQVNVAREEQKSGCDPDDAEQLALAIAAATHLRLDGLMTIAPLADDPEDVRPVFAGLRELRDRLQAEQGLQLPVLSMGMSNDYPVAIAEGATHIRVGRALFAS
jgi:pyridoxal phosphate enzyme (YggS family)